MTKMTVQYLHFEGLNAPVCVQEPEVVMPWFDPVFAGWRFDVSAENHLDQPPFATIGPTGDGRKWRLAAPRAEKTEAFHDPVNAICDLIVEISWERLRSRPDLLCLHAAALPFGDRLVLFPNARRAGKSLLTATLARAGHPVFTDDFVPLAIDPATQVISGLANGIAPRLRLPLPETLPADHAKWIEGHITSRNKQYGYLSEIDLPPSGSEMPVGAIVLLDRDMDRAEPPVLTPVPADEAMAAVVKQNFGRQVHAGAILTITEAIATSVPVLKLTYSDVLAAARLLSEAEALRDLPPARVSAKGRVSTNRLAPLETPAPTPPDPLDLSATFARVPGYTEVTTEKAIYLASARGMTIQQLNPVSMIIWTLLDTPLSGDHLTHLLRTVFPDVATAQLHDDLHNALRYMIRDGLLSV